jgi:Acyl-CoA synthetases (AMP-forming)/AMP-acid ligases II
MNIWNYDYRTQIGDVRTLILTSAEKFKNKTFIRPNEPKLPSISFAELVQFASGLESFLEKKGVKKGEMVSVVFHNSTLLALLFLSVIYSRRVFVPINPYSSSEEIDYILSDADPKLVIYDYNLKKNVEKVNSPVRLYRIKEHSEFIDSISSIIFCGESQPENHSEQTPEMPAQIVYTSGTTGNPKGVVLSHENLLEDSFCIGQNFGFSSDDRFLTVTPLFHNSGQISTTLGPL